MILRDPVHGLVAFESDEEHDRRRAHRHARGAAPSTRSPARRDVARVPGAEHSRFAHAIGAAFVMKLLLARLRAIHGVAPRLAARHHRRARDALAAAFLHDVGHGPLSHLFEDAIPGRARTTKSWTERIVLDPSTGVHQVLARSTGVAAGARRRILVHGAPRAAVSRQGGERRVRRRPLRLPAPRRARDRRPLRHLRSRLAPAQPALRAAGAERAPSLAIDGAKGLPAIEAFIIARLFMFQQVYLHKATRAAEWMIRAILARAVARSRRGAASRGRRAPSSSAAHGEDDSAPRLPRARRRRSLACAMHAWETLPGRTAAPISRGASATARFSRRSSSSANRPSRGPRERARVARDSRSPGLDPDVTSASTWRATSPSTRSGAARRVREGPAAPAVGGLVPAVAPQG